MCLFDLLATGQPSEVKRVSLQGLADRVRGPRTHGTFEGMLLPWKQALCVDRKQAPGQGLSCPSNLPPSHPGSPSGDLEPPDPDLVQTPQIFPRPQENWLPYSLLWKPHREALRSQKREELPVCAPPPPACGGAGHLAEISGAGHSNAYVTDEETEAH